MCITIGIKFFQENFMNKGEFSVNKKKQIALALGLSIALLVGLGILGDVYRFSHVVDPVLGGAGYGQT